MPLQILDLGEQDAGGLAKDLVELAGILLPGALEIFHRGLQRKKRVFQFVRQPARQFPPSGHALGLNQPLALLGQLPGHLVEGAGELANFIAPADIHARAPVSLRHFARAFGQLAHRPRDSRGHPPAQKDAKKEAHADHRQRQQENAAFERDRVMLRAAHKQDAEQIVLPAHQRQRVKHLRARWVRSPGDFECLLAGLLALLIDDGSEAIRVRHGP